MSSTGDKASRNGSETAEAALPRRRPGQQKRRLNSTWGCQDDGQFTVEDISNDDTGYEGDIEVIWPYQYEEADQEKSNDPSTVVSRGTSPKRLKEDDIWNSGLIDWMGSLHCDSDAGPRRQGRDRKRKSRPSWDRQRGSFYDGGQMGNYRPGFRPKKARRQSSKHGDSSLSDASPALDSQDSPSTTTTASPTTPEDGSSTTRTDLMDID